MFTRLVFILTLFVSAFLSFSIQPILGKMMLPLVGGAASAWIVAMAFFQLALLGGYTVSHLLRRVTPFYHGLILCVLYGIGLAFLPASFPSSFGLSESPFLIAWDVFKLLLITIAVPFMALTATTSALLRIFSRTDDHTAHDPYYLFIASNAGSLIGLFIFPLWLERIFSLQDLSQFWFIGYSMVMGSIIVILMLTAKNPHIRQQPTSAAQATIVTFKHMTTWFCLAFVPCSLSMGITALITTDMGSFPLFWTLPLGLYLLSFIFAFQQKPFFKLADLHFWHVCSAAILLALIVQGSFAHAPNLITLAFALFLLLGLFFVICLSVHQTLATLRPAADRVTLYYLIIALGGAVAGMLNAFAVPFIFNDASEFVISIILSLLLPMVLHKTLIPNMPRKVLWFFRGLLVLALLSLIARHYGMAMPSVDDNMIMAITIVFMMSTFLMAFYPRYLPVIGVAVMVYYMTTPYMGHYILKYRNFFSSSVVMEYERDNRTIRALRHGNTLHGMVLMPEHGEDHAIDMSVGYYSNKGPVQDIYTITKPKDIAILGLGTGQLACYQDNANVTFFEIDPDMVTLAQDYFPYLKHCPVKDIVIGDGRLAFAKETRDYDLLFLDAFSSDGIPIHLLTREAMQMYPQHLRKNGLMLYHVSNRYLMLDEQIAATAHSLGLKAYQKAFSPDKKIAPFAMASSWVAVPLDNTHDQALLDKGWSLIDPTKAMPWTDQKSSLMSVLRKPKHDLIFLKHAQDKQAPLKTPLDNILPKP